MSADASRPLAEQVAAYTQLSPDAAEAQQLVQALAAALDARRLVLLDVVQAMGPMLSGAVPDPVARARVIHLLACVLGAMDPASGIVATHAATLLPFFLARLEDQPSIEASIQGLLNLSLTTIWSADQIALIMSALVSDIALQQFPQAARHAVFSLFDRLLDANLAQMQQHNDLVVQAFIHALDGEKDPRCLLLAFTTAQRIYQHFTILADAAAAGADPDDASLAETLFDVTSCYFPITFRPPPGDPFGITPEQLKNALHPLLVAIPENAPFALPFLSEKLTAESRHARRDAMEVLALGHALAPHDVVPYLGELWSSIRAEVVHAHDDSGERAALAAITTLTTVLARDAARIDAFLADTIERDVVRKLNDPDANEATAHGKIVAAVMSGLAKAAAGPSIALQTRLWHAARTTLLRRARGGAASPSAADGAAAPAAPTPETESTSSLAERRAALEAIHWLLRASRFSQFATASEPHPMAADGQTLFEIEIDALNSHTAHLSLTLEAILGLKDMLLAPRLLTPERQTETRHVFMSLLTLSGSARDADDRDAIEATFIVAARACAEQHPDWFDLEAMTPYRLALGQPAQPDFKPSPDSPFASLLHVFVALAELEPLTQSHLLQLFDVAETYVTAAPSSSPHALTTTGADHLVQILDAVTQIVQSRIARTSKPMPDAQAASSARQHQADAMTQLLAPPHTLVHRALAMAFSRALTPHAAAETAVAALVRTLVQRADAAQQQQLADTLLPALWTATAAGPPACMTAVQAAAGRSFALDTTPYVPFAGVTAAAVQAVVCHLRPATDLHLPEGLATMHAWLTASLDAPPSDASASLAATLATLVNKLGSDAQVTAWLSGPGMTRLREAMTKPMAHPEAWILNTLAVYRMQVKACMLRWHPSTEAELDVLLGWMDPAVCPNADLAGHAAAAVGVIAETDSTTGILTRDAYATVKYLVSQRFFARCLPRLVAGFHAAEASRKPVWLTAVSHLIRHVPRKALLTELPRLVPLLLVALRAGDAPLRVATLDTAAMMLQDAPETFARDLDGWLSALIANVGIGPSPRSELARLAQPAPGSASGAMPVLQGWTTMPLRVRQKALEVLARVPDVLTREQLEPHAKAVMRCFVLGLDDRKRVVRQTAANARLKWSLFLGQANGSGSATSLVVQPPA